MQELKYPNCFVCGNENPTGLKLDFSYDETSALTWFDSPLRFEGYQGVIHGGIIATLLDEEMAKIIISRKLIAVTADMTIRYRKPLPVGKKVKARGEIALQKTRTIRAKAVLADEEGTVYAESEGIYVVVKTL